ncbi:hypothetical protein DFH61_000758 [Clostridium beijerinckii]|nr:hypothetical protein [Clostridium beijerinckii]
MYVKKFLNNITCKEYCNAHNYKYSVIKEEHSQKYIYQTIVIFLKLLILLIVNFLKSMCQNYAM